MTTPDGFRDLIVTTSIAQPGAVAVDDAGISWLDQGLNGATNGKVSRADPGGGNPKDLATKQSPIGLSTSCADVFWTTIDKGVFGIPKTGGAAFTYQQPSGMPTIVDPGVAADGARVYFAQGSSVVADPFGQQIPTALAQGQQNPGAIALDGEAICFTTTTAGGGGAIVKASK